MLNATRGGLARATGTARHHLPGGLPGISRRVRSMMAATVVGLLAAAACSSDGEQADPERTGRPAVPITASTSTTTTTTTTTTTAPPPTSAPTTTTTAPVAPPDPGITCAGDEALRSDVTGDGIDDTVIHRVDPGTGAAVLEVCLGAFGGGYRIPGVGGATVLELADVNRSRSVEIFYGSVDGLSQEVQVARWVDGALAVVTTDDEPLVLVGGWPDEPPPDGLLWGYGCLRELDGERIHLVSVTFEIDPGRFVATSVGYHLAGAVARPRVEAVVALEDGGFELTDEDPAEQVAEVVEQYAPAC